MENCPDANSYLFHKICTRASEMVLKMLYNCRISRFLILQVQPASKLRLLLILLEHT
jgi:hypothetical protein